ncbi:hypothetical protein [Bradyrhizobium monzae]|uniref:hypothetical protein n=1 Tax=Bradyrhizobium sp. Oc8 TaxID=2876780 RepID=UPI001F20671B|nr:hypothetical protein [Bradyrhizobium sp. Oc8]
MRIDPVLWRKRHKRSAKCFASSPAALADATSAAASTLYRSNSPADSAISTLWSFTTIQVATPATSAKPPAMIKNTTMAFSQPWSDKPSIRLASFDRVAIRAIAVLLVGFLALLIAVVWDLIIKKR